MFFVSLNVSAMSEKEVKVSSDGFELSGSLVEADNNRRGVVLLLIAGSGPTDRNGNQVNLVNNSMKQLATELSKLGISSLRYDKRGVGASNNTPLIESELSIKDYINDAKVWLSYLLEHKQYNKIIVAGHSEGALIGSVIAQEDGVDRFISISGVSEPADKLLKKQLSALPEPLLGEANRVLDSLVLGETVNDLPEQLNSIFRPSVQPYLISWFQLDPREEIAKVKVPVLIVHGERDIQVGAKSASELNGSAQHSKLVEIKAMNHIFKQVDQDIQSNINSYNNPNLPISGDLVNTVARFALSD